MRLGECDVRLGGQGWSEPDWNGVFYPRGLAARARLSSYASAFDFVEIDSTFYAAPPAATVRKWRDSVPATFRFAAKVPQAITHDPDLATRQPRRPLEAPGWQEQLAQFVDTMRLLDDRLLALLLQLPPQWHWQPERLAVLERALAALPRDVQWAVEFRHRGWLNDAVFALLREHQVAFTIQDLYYMPRHVEVTTPALAYVRLQGKRREIVRMDAIQIERDEALDYWAEVVRQLAAQAVRTVIVAANNHYQGHSPGTVAALQRRLGLPVGLPPAQRAAQLPLA
ncbi:MAG TPA: DUF72 domain-containing protein [Chloroflexota bacterium]|nr:DUF72 domain-containing protein [Chloroflexota bacterium]